jgi:adenylate cyclase
VADVVGYGRLMGEDETGTLARLKVYRRDLIDPAIAQFHGRIIKLMGDGTLIEFASVVDAVECAASIQRAMATHDAETAESRRIRFRIGVNLGDVIVDGDDIYGDGVNIAARLEATAEPGGICISGTAFDQAVHKVDVGFASLGELRLKNIADPVRAYRVLLEAGESGKIVSAPHRLGSRVYVSAALATVVITLFAIIFAWQKPSIPQRPSVAVLPFANVSGDPSQDYFADGITEDLITDLAKLSGLDVVARNSVVAYKGRLGASTEIARDLGAQFVVEGSVRRTGEQIRLNAKLTEISTGKTLWANRFDRDVVGVFAIQDLMGRDIAKALGMQPTVAESEQMARPPTTNLEAYDYYLRAEQAARSGQSSGLQKALALYEKAEILPKLLQLTRARLSMSGVRTSTASSRARWREREPMTRQVTLWPLTQTFHRHTPF